MKRRIYMDNMATTPLDPRVLTAMTPYLTDRYGNAASAEHSFGWEAEEAAAAAAEQVAGLIGASPREIVWTSGATESINLALKGAAGLYTERGRHLITCSTEHSAVLDTAGWLAGHACEVSILPVDAEGMIDLDELCEAIRPDTILVSLMAANNETGVLHPLAEIGRITRERGALFHVDAAQAFGKIPIDVEEMNIDLLSISGHKVYGPKGVGALYLRGREPRVRLETQMHGGGQQGGLRSGTLNVPGIVGLGKAAAICGEEMPAESERVARLRDRLVDGIRARLEGVSVQGGRSERVAGCANLGFAGVDAEGLVTALRGIALASGSACSSAEPGPSHVLLAMGLERELAHSAIRFGLGRFTAVDEVDEIVERVVTAVSRLRAADPLAS